MLNFIRNTKDGDLVPNSRIEVDNQIYLGGYHIGDKKKLVQYLNDQDIFENTLNIPNPYTKESANWWIDHITKEGIQLKFQPNWTIRHREHGLIGAIGMVISGNTIEAEQEIGYWLAKPFRRKGIMTQCITVFSQYCFKKFKTLESISAHIFVQNEASQATIKKAGFTMIRLIDNYYRKNDQHIAAYEFMLQRLKK